MLSEELLQIALRRKKMPKAKEKRKDIPVERRVPKNSME